MFDTNKGIKSGKNMNDPVIVNKLSTYLSTTIVKYYNKSNPMYFFGDGYAGVCSGYFEYDNNQLVFISKNPKDTTRSFTQKIPLLTNIGAWISGGEGDWDISPIVTVVDPTDPTDPTKKIDKTDWNKRNTNWGVAKGLTGLVNTGIPYNMIGTIDNPMGTWTTSANMANYYKADFYNLYARVAQASGCNAYVNDFGDVLGADGTLVGKVGDNDVIIVTLNYTP